MLKVPLEFESDEEMERDRCANEPLTLSSPPLVATASPSGSAEHIPGENYMIHLKLISGHNLAVRDVTGRSDPYVKLKHGRYKARSSVIYRNLNPQWMEKFIFQTKDLSLPLNVKVYDHDIVSSDDFMGQGTIHLNKYEHNKVEVITLSLTDPVAPAEELGYLQLEIKVLNMTYHEQHAYEQQKLQQSKKKIQCWNSILTVTVLGATDLPAMDSNGFSDPYCKFKLGSQKYKTKVQPKTLNPEWKEKFDMKLYDDQSKQSLYIEVWDRDFPAADDFIGECFVELCDYEPDVQHDLRLPVGESSGTLHLLLVISGLSCKEESDVLSGNLIKQAKIDFQLQNFVKLFSAKEIGLLHITIERGADLCSYNERDIRSFVTIEVGNAQLRTHAVSYTADPIWNKTFSFPIKDIHDIVHIEVINERKGKEEWLGQLMIPLLRLQVGRSKTYVLKGKSCLNRAHGTITINCDLVYNIVCAGLQTLKPKEVPVLEEEPKFQRKLLLRNIHKIIELIHPVVQIHQYIQELLSWQNSVQSSIALTVFTVACLAAEIWIIFFLLAFVFIMYYIKAYIKHESSYFKESYQRVALQVDDNSENESDFSDLEDYSHTKDPSEHVNWRQRFRQFQDILLTLQIMSGYVVDLSERVKNLFHWTVPFLCWMAILICLLAMILTYFVPLRYIILIWGLYKMTKRLWKQRQIPNNEILDFLSRAPTDLELLQWKELARKNT